jgi:hypothetical protein
MSQLVDRYLLTAYRTAARLPIVRTIAVSASQSRHLTERVQATGLRLDLLIDSAPPDRRVTELQALGYSAGLSLTPQFVEQLHSELTVRTLVEDGSGREVPFAQAVKENGSPALRWMNPHLTYQPLRALALDDRLVAVARQYLGCQPILHSSQIWLLHPPAAAAARSAEYGWHYDIDDFRFLKVFFYLSDTRTTRGQHMLVAASHRDMRPHRLMHRRATDGDVHARYPADRILEMEGKSGEGFFEDTWLYHRATPPSATRYMLQIEYCATGALKRLEQRL